MGKKQFDRPQNESEIARKRDGKMNAAAANKPNNLPTSRSLVLNNT